MASNFFEKITLKNFFTERRVIEIKAIQKSLQNKVEIAVANKKPKSRNHIRDDNSQWILPRHRMSDQDVILTAVK